MSFFKRLFSKEKKPKVEPMHGIGPIQTEAEKDSTRDRMEAEMAGERERRSGSTPVPPKDDSPPGAP